RPASITAFKHLGIRKKPRVKYPLAIKLTLIDSINVCWYIILQSDHRLPIGCPQLCLRCLLMDQGLHLIRGGSGRKHISGIH
ncbi:hypothetical protein, partial [Acinetobacter baumannii]|uniref:hypothetical protein n=1 Tax=Acinetobacter baumannii TaxID=470 RepID=UPI001C072C0F